MKSGDFYRAVNRDKSIFVIITFFGPTFSLGLSKSKMSPVFDSYSKASRTLANL
jgi:hypothetical protein